MPRLTWVFAGHIGHFVGFVMFWLKCLSPRLDTSISQDSRKYWEFTGNTGINYHHSKKGYSQLESSRHENSKLLEHGTPGVAIWHSSLQHGQLSGLKKKMLHHKTPKNSDTQKNCCIYAKNCAMLFYYGVMHLKDVVGMANCADPDQTALASDLGLHCLPRHVCPRP